MPVRVSDHLADTLYLGAEQPSAVFHFFPLEILDGDDVVLAWNTGSAPNAWNSRALPADVLEIRAGYWNRGHTRQERGRIAANLKSNPNKASLAARVRWTTTVAAKVIAVDACLSSNSATGIARCALVPGDATSKSQPGSAL
jgi:hypothetical protein